VKIIGAKITKGDSTTRCELRILKCKLDGACPVHNDGACIHGQMFERCPYGRYEVEKGYTTRSQKARPKWMKAAKERIKDLPPWPKYAEREMQLLGEYVWCPYPHINWYDGPVSSLWLAPCGPFIGLGTPYIKQEDLTPEVVLKIARLHPKALTGGEITDYQQKSVPAFLLDLSRKLPHTYEEAVKLAPELADKTPGWMEYRNKTVLLRHVAPGTKVKVTRGDLTGLWDGHQLHLDPESAEKAIGLYTIWFKTESAAVTLSPKPGNRVIVLTEREIRRLFNAGHYGGVIK